MSRSNKAFLRIAPQTTVGTVPTTDWTVLPRTTDGLNNSVEMTTSETIIDTRLRTAGLPTQASAEGDVTVEFIKGTYDELMAAAAGNEWATDVLTFGGDVQKMYAIEKYNSDLGLYHLWEGMRVNTMSLTIPENGFISMVFGFIGQNYETGAVAYSTTPADVATSPKASQLQVDDIQIDGVSTVGAACVSEFSLEINNNIDPRRCIGAGLYSNKLLELMQDITGSLTLAYSNTTQDYISKQMTGEPVSISVAITFEDGSSYTLNIPKAQVSGDIPTGGANDLLDATVNYTVIVDDAATDAPTITRVIA